MPPKPWESMQRQQQTANVVSELKRQQSEPVKIGPEEAGIGQISPQQAQQVSSQSAQAGTNNTTGLNGIGTGYGSSMGGLGGYGSSMGGYGGMSGYGGMGGYGGYGGMGGMGGYGGMGYGYGMGGGMGGMMGMGGAQNSQIMQTLEYLNSVGFLVNSLCEIARVVEMNAQGLSNLWVSLWNLVKRIYRGNKWLWHIIISTIKRAIHEAKMYISFENETDSALKKKIKTLCILVAICLCSLVSTFLIVRRQENRLDELFN